MITNMVYLKNGEKFLIFLGKLCILQIVKKQLFIDFYLYYNINVLFSTYKNLFAF